MNEWQISSYSLSISKNELHFCLKVRPINRRACLYGITSFSWATAFTLFLVFLIYCSKRQRFFFHLSINLFCSFFLFSSFFNLRLVTDLWCRSLFLSVVFSESVVPVTILLVPLELGVRPVRCIYTAMISLWRKAIFKARLSCRKKTMMTLRFYFSFKSSLEESLTNMFGFWAKNILW